MLAGALAALLLVAPLGSGELVLTQRDSGHHVAIARGQSATLRLSGGWTWTEPKIAGNAIRLDRVDYLVDPGYTEWQIEVLRPGTAVVTSTGRPVGGGRARHFRVTLTVRRH